MTVAAAVRREVWTRDALEADDEIMVVLRVEGQR
jgi:hypothetical protein